MGQHWRLLQENLIIFPGFISHVEHSWDSPDQARWLNQRSHARSAPNRGSDGQHPSRPSGAYAHAKLVELDGPDHIYWLGDNALQIADLVANFIAQSGTD